MIKKLIVSLAIVFTGCSALKEEADTIYYNARVITVDSSGNIDEAFVVRDGKIIDVGSSLRMRDLYTARENVDLDGACVVPGLIDAHCHFTGYATDMWKCNLTGTKSFSEVVERINVYAQNAPMEWIYGRGWDQNDWVVKEFPDKRILDSMFPSRPVFLKRIDGHAALVNQFVLDKFGITASTKVTGGSVELKGGKPTGILIDNAMDLVDLKIPAISDSLAATYFAKAQQNCFAVGLTQVHDCGVTEATVDLIDKEQKAGRLQMKMVAYLSDNAAYYDKWLKKGVYKTPLLRVGGFKIYADGALGSRGACLTEDYADKAGWRGFMLTDAARVKEIAKMLSSSPFQMCTHAIGDSANKYMLDVYNEALGEGVSKRWRIEHAQVLHAEDFTKFKKRGIIPSVQPTHATSDMYWAKDRLGASRIKHAYAYKKMLENAGMVALGTDFPVEDISPFKTFYAAVTRKDSTGYPDEGFNFENAMNHYQALTGMTKWAAYAGFMEAETGSIEKGKCADFVILSNDLLNCDDAQILKTTVKATYINGERVYYK